MKSILSCDGWDSPGSFRKKNFQIRKLSHLKKGDSFLYNI